MNAPDKITEIKGAATAVAAIITDERNQKAQG